MYRQVIKVKTVPDNKNEGNQYNKDHARRATAITNEWWEAIEQNDAAYNDLFFYAVQSTGIFCKPSCRSRTPRRDNVEIYSSAEEALLAGFRPCKRCKPTNEKLPDEEWILSIVDYMNQNYRRQLTLELLGQATHSSPYHLQRTFKRIMGVTPTEYMQQLRLSKAQEALKQSNLSVEEIAESVGIGNTGYFITWFKRELAVTPARYRKLNQGRMEGSGEEEACTRNN